MRAKLALLWTALLTGVVALTGSVALASQVSVAVGSFYFEDSTVGDGKIVVNQGDRITFVFQGNAQHTATVNGMFDSQRKGGGDTYTTGTLTTAGTFSLYCGVHGAARHSSTLIIKSTSTASATPAPQPSATNAATTAPSTPAGSGGSSARPGGGSQTSAAPASSTTTSPAPGAKATNNTTTAEASTSPKPGATNHAGGAPSVAVPVIPGSLPDLLGRQPAARGVWTRSVRQALLLLLPLSAAAAWAIRGARRRSRDELPS